MRVQSSEAIGKRSLVKLRDNFSLMFLNDCLKFSVGDIRKNIPDISADLSPARRETQGWGCFSPAGPYGILQGWRSPQGGAGLGQASP